MSAEWLFDGASVAEDLSRFSCQAEDALDDTRSVLERGDEDALSECDLQALRSTYDSLAETRRLLWALDDGMLGDAQKLILEILDRTARSEAPPLAREA